MFTASQLIQDSCNIYSLLLSYFDMFEYVLYFSTMYPAYPTYTALIRLWIHYCFFMIVCFFIGTRANFQLFGGCRHYRRQGYKFRPMLGAHEGLWSGRDLYRATPTATRDLGLYDLIWKTGTHVPQWDSNPRHKDDQIFVPDALTTAPRGRDP